ncbi:unnamed protein product [Aureobasidium uvarum]|uniref:Uncharacterized protein n=1 Tax=Aureobasidium uvarum TaxID=2773716 RepID=A0A9N8KG56_9PEZI|nr:unnamed protein product [Aureobasidium uvarum]
MAPKKKVERTAASSRPKRTPKPTTFATSSSAAAPKPKKKSTATKKAATKTAAPKKTAATKVTKKTAPKKTVTKKAATKAAAMKAGAKGAQKDAPKYEKWVVPLWVNPLGAEGEKRIAQKKELEKSNHQMWKASVLSCWKHSAQFKKGLKQDYEEGVAKGEYEPKGYERFRTWSMKIYSEAWDKAYARKIGSLEGDYNYDEAKAMKREMCGQMDNHEIPHIHDFEGFLYWKEIEKQRAKLVTKYKAEYKAEQKKKQQQQKGNVSAISSPVKKAQNTIVNASPVKNVQEAFARSRSKSPEKKSPAKKMLSNDSGYQADNEQQSVMSRTWELAANAVEAMRSAVNPE